MVYRSGGSLFSLQLPEQTPAAAAAAAVAGSEIDVTLLSDRAQMGEHWVNGREWLSWTSVSPDGSRVAMISRGVLFTAPAPVGRNKHRVGARLVQVAPNITNGTQSSFICSLTVVSFCKLNDPFAALSLALSLSPPPPPLPPSLSVCLRWRAAFRGRHLGEQLALARGSGHCARG